MNTAKIDAELNPESLFLAYENIRGRLPEAQFPARANTINSVHQIADQFDVFLFDAFGVLNVGDKPVAAAQELVKDLQGRGKQVFVLTNAASHPSPVLHQKFCRLGYRFARHHIVSSRDLLENELLNRPVGPWGVMAPMRAGLEALHGETFRLGDDAAEFERAKGFILLSSAGWTASQQEMLVASLSETPRPVLVANPDIAAPREVGFSRQAGWFAHDLARRTNTSIEFFGKPFKPVYDLALSRVEHATAHPRTVMIGDSLHTDILGGAAAGLKTILVTGHGVMAGQNVNPFIRRSGIVPSWIANTL